MHLHKCPFDLSPYKVVYTWTNIYSRQHDNTSFRAHSGQLGKINGHLSLFLHPPPYLFLAFSATCGCIVQLVVWFMIQ